MYLQTVTSKNSVCYYVAQSFRKEDGKHSTRVYETLGTPQEIMAKHNVTDVLAWCKNYVDELNKREKQKKKELNRTLTVSLNEGTDKGKESNVFNAGYLILEKMYYALGMGNICDEIQESRPHVAYSLDNVLKLMLFGRIIAPSSKLELATGVQKLFIENGGVELQHIYRGMDLLNSQSDTIHDRLYYYSGKMMDRNIHRLYYDCTNFYCEIEKEDDAVAGKSEEWHKEHKLRKYGHSKENRPNPIVQMGLFMDGDGMPLGFCINPGNTNEQTTMKPLERKIIKELLNF